MVGERQRRAEEMSRGAVWRRSVDWVARLGVTCEAWLLDLWCWWARAGVSTFFLVSDFFCRLFCLAIVVSKKLREGRGKKGFCRLGLVVEVEVLGARPNCWTLCDGMVLVCELGEDCSSARGRRVGRIRSFCCCVLFQEFVASKCNGPGEVRAKKRQLKHLNPRCLTWRSIERQHFSSTVCLVFLSINQQQVMPARYTRVNSAIAAICLYGIPMTWNRACRMGKTIRPGTTISSRLRLTGLGASASLPRADNLGG
ncbi:hypothetical protein JOL62DRAFT_253822 [Phyllosticta paracitricarpa]|uniref:Uncharacterized protein n=1 Tax=Phyllosticta paracitricarpa TaxID=2016321 RepID=A0ABR1N198_9PEZI